MRHKILISARAWSHLDELYSYLRGKAGPEIADSFLGGVQQSILGLADFPFLGKRRSSGRIPGLYTISHKSRTVIAYTVDERAMTVIVLGVYYGGRDYETDLDISND